MFTCGLYVTQPQAYGAVGAGNITMLSTSTYRYYNKAAQNTSDKKYLIFISVTISKIQTMTYVPYWKIHKNLLADLRIELERIYAVLTGRWVRHFIF